MDVALPENPEDENTPQFGVLRPLVECLHALWQTLPQGFALAFPDMKEVDGKWKWGARLSIYSDMAGLRDIKNAPMMAELLRERCHASVIVRVNASPSWTSFKRTREDMASPSRIARERRRLAAGGPRAVAIGANAFMQKIMEQGPVPDAVVAEVLRRPSVAPWIVIGSRSTQQQFRLSVSRQAAVSPGNGLFDSYGLSSGGAVPC
jgi:CRISPR-associated endoribonuclease Cas6/Csy4 subtype I-F